MRRQRTAISPSPARFMPVSADIGECDFVDGAPSRDVLADIAKRMQRGEIIAPVRRLNKDSNEWRDHGWRPSSVPWDSK